MSELSRHVTREEQTNILFGSDEEALNWVKGTNDERTGMNKSFINHARVMHKVVYNVFSQALLFC